MPPAIQKISSDFRKTAAAAKIGRLLFDPSVQFKLSPTQIASLMKQLGFDFPKEIDVSLKAAQVIMSGGAIINNINAGKSFLEIGSNAASTVGQIYAIIQALGIIENEVLAKSISVGVNTAMVVSSGGTNVYADIALVADLISAALFPPDDRPKAIAALDQANYIQLKSVLDKRNDIQKKNASNLIANFQDKKISMFEFVGEFALNAGDYFYNYFPEYKVFIPPSMLSVGTYAEQKASYGGFLFFGRKSETIRRSVSVEWESVATNRFQVMQGFIKKFIEVPFAPYFLTANLPEATYKIKPHQLAALAVISDFENVGDGFDIVPHLNKLWLTPSDLGVPWLLEQKLKTDYIPAAQAAISFNGVDAYAKPGSFQGNNLDLLSMQRAIEADKNGDISTLIKNKKVYDILKDWGTLPRVSESLKSLAGNVDYLNIMNFFSVLSIVDYMEKDSWLTEGREFMGGWNDAIRPVQWLFPARQAIEEYYNSLLMTSSIRFINLQARENVAKYYQTTQTKVDFKTNKDGTAYVVPKK